MVSERRARVLNTILIVVITSINIATFSATLHSAAYGSVNEHLPSAELVCAGVSVDVTRVGSSLKLSQSSGDHFAELKSS